MSQREAGYKTRAGYNDPMARLAWFTPLPPVRSGIAAYNAELLPLLGAAHEIDVFTGSIEASPTPSRSAAAGLRVFAAHDFPWKQDQAPYDLIVYQLGNAACHDFMWPHLARFPGLVVLHDGQLHHERSRALLSRGRLEHYRAEFRYNHPDAPAQFPDLVISALGGALYYLYPMLRWVLRTARLAAVHSRGLASELTTAHPGVEVLTIQHGMVDPVTKEALRASEQIRERLAIPSGSVLFAAFGLVTPEKRISAALRAVARLAAEHPDVYLLLVGGTTDYFDAAAEARSLGLADRVRITGYVADEDLPAHVLAADACLCLRWPTSRETSGTWIRAIAAGKPTVVTDLAHAGEVPALDPRTWHPLPAALPAEGFSPARGAGAEAGPTAGPRPASVVSLAIDVLDEDESLYLAMERLAIDADLRRDLGVAGREYWRAHHTMERAVEGYLQAIARALQRPIPHVRDLPGHLLEDGTELARHLVGPFGVEVDFLQRGS